MDLFTKRCGCGAIYKPAVVTQRACASCTTRNITQARASTPAGSYKEPKAKVPYQEPQPLPSFPQIRIPKGPRYQERVPMVPNVFPEGFQYSVDDLRPSPRTRAGNPVNGVEIPPDTAYGPRHPVEWKTEHSVVLGIGGQVFRTSRKVPTYAAATLQSIIEEVDHAVRCAVCPAGLTRPSMYDCRLIVETVERELEHLLPVNVSGRVTSYGPAEDGRGFKVSARIFGAESCDLTWTFR